MAKKPARDVQHSPLPLPLPSVLPEQDAAEMRRRRIGARLKSEREKRGWSQRQLAEVSGYSQSTITKVENGQFDIRSETLQTITEALGMAMSAIEQLAIGNYQLGSIEFRAKVAIMRGIFDGSLNAIAKPCEDIHSVLARHNDPDYRAIPLSPSQLDGVLNNIADNGLLAEAEDGTLLLWDEDPRSANNILADYEKHFDNLLKSDAMGTYEIFHANCEKAIRILAAAKADAQSPEDFMSALQDVIHVFTFRDVLETQVALGYHRALCLYYQLLLARVPIDNQAMFHDGFQNILIELVLYRVDLHHYRRQIQPGSHGDHETAKPPYDREPKPALFRLLKLCGRCNVEKPSDLVQPNE